MTRDFRLPEVHTCTQCGRPMMTVCSCERDPGGRYCEACFDKHPCLNEHEPGCASTLVVTGAPRSGPPPGEIH